MWACQIRPVIPLMESLMVKNEENLSKKTVCFVHWCAMMVVIDTILCYLLPSCNPFYQCHRAFGNSILSCDIHPWKGLNGI